MEHKSTFIKICVLLILLVITYLSFQKFFDLIDTKCFLFLNKNFLNSQFSQNFWGILSHKNESWINVVIMFGINLLSIFMIAKVPIRDTNFLSINSNNFRYKVIAIVLYCWVSFQIVLLTNIIIFQKILHIHRDSPSIVIENAVRLSKILNNPNIKDYSNNSFPAGHALVLIYWTLFINLYAPKLIKIMATLLCVFLILPRMIVGAHWFSDTVFSFLLAWMYFNLSMWFANSYDQIKNRLY